MHVAGLIGTSIANNASLSDDDIQELRIAALLHDIGHGPFSHLFEEVLARKTDISHEDITQRIVLESEVRDILDRNGLSPTKMSRLAVGKMAGPPFMNEVISGGLSADMMDYLLRDTYFTGVEYGKVDIHRVIDSLGVIGDHLVLDRAALYAFEALLIARYEMFKAVYFHRTVRAAELMLAQSMALADDELQLTNLKKIERILRLTDEVVLQELDDLRSTKPELRLAQKLAEDYLERRLVKCVFESVIQRKDRAIQKVFSRKKIRDELASEIAQAAGVKTNDVYIDVSNTPSFPYTYQRHTFNSITLFSNTLQGRKVETVPLKELPLVGSIAGFMNVLRIYTVPRHRIRVSKSIQSIFGKHDPMSRVPI